jgi:hypothetical protein
MGPLEISGNLLPDFLRKNNLTIRLKLLTNYELLDLLID